MDEEWLLKGAQKPVGKFAKFTDGIWREVTDGSAGVPLYTHPVKELTDKEITELFRASSDHIEFARAILRKA